MKVIIKKELKGFLKNPIYYAGILLIVFGLFQILQPYLKLHYWENDAQVASARLKNIADADIMDGYLQRTQGITGCQQGRDRCDNRNVSEREIQARRN